jgi:hypothetical protein
MEEPRGKGLEDAPRIMGMVPKGDILRVTLEVEQECISGSLQSGRISP